MHLKKDEKRKNWRISRKKYFFTKGHSVFPIKIPLSKFPKIPYEMNVNYSKCNNTLD